MNLNILCSDALIKSLILQPPDGAIIYPIATTVDICSRVIGRDRDRKVCETSPYPFHICCQFENAYQLIFQSHGSPGLNIR